MPLLSPRRYQPPFYPYDRDPFLLRLFTAFERISKGIIWGCRMCGNCILQETAFVCPMTCAKGMRNGLCGGASSEHCYVEPTRKCTSSEIYKRAEKWRQLDKLLEINAPVDGRQAGHEAWLALYKFWRQREQGPSVKDVVVNRKKFNEELHSLFFDLRQPEWWQGDALYHAPAYDEPVSNLEAQLRSGQFTVTAEIAPPLGASDQTIEKWATLFKGQVVAANFTDNASAAPRMGSLACARLCLDYGLEPVLQIQTRDRTRVALESDAMGAAGLGIRNILCLTGDHLSLGLGATPMPDQHDMDGIQLLWMLRRMRDDHVYLDGRNIKIPPKFFLGAAASPYAAIPRYEALRTEKKVNAGAQFIQTQPIFDYDRFLEWMEEIDKRNLTGKTYILAGLVPLKSPRAAHFMADLVPGVEIPDSIVKRMDEASEPQEEGVQIALEIIEKLKGTPGIHGIHVMAVHWESIVPRLIEEGDLPLPIASSPEQEAELLADAEQPG
jgi:methylenetetrahydrofolate reductase (NADPH)